jgi:hypothetical protein
VGLGNLDISGTRQDSRSVPQFPIRPSRFPTTRLVRLAEVTDAKGLYRIQEKK